uniref:Complex III subunit 9 n=1 Tax=Rhodnius prolixus TaxID=13249 RepID=T1HNQ4_RHOPR
MAMEFFNMKFMYDKLIRWTGNSQWWVVCGAIMLEPALDFTVEKWFEKRNKGKLWNDVERNLKEYKAAAEK